MVDKWISPGGSHGGKGKSLRFHTMPDKCSYVQNMKKKRKADDHYLEWHEAEECKDCRAYRENAGIEIEGYSGTQ